MTLTRINKSRSAHGGLLISALPTPKSFALNLCKTSSQSQSIRRPLALTSLTSCCSLELSGFCRFACVSPEKPEMCLKIPLLRRAPHSREGLWGFTYRVLVLHLLFSQPDLESVWEKRTWMFATTRYQQTKRFQGCFPQGLITSLALTALGCPPTPFLTGIGLKSGTFLHYKCILPGRCFRNPCRLAPFRLRSSWRGQRTGCPSVSIQCHSTYREPGAHLSTLHAPTTLILVIMPIYQMVKPRLRALTSS